jgi:hypothetical protein
MNQEMKNWRVESLGQATLNSYNFKSLRNRFDDTQLYNKAGIPGPGAYNLDIDKFKTSKTVGTLLNINSHQTEFLAKNKIVNPPSIPSHMNIFGYDENELGHLIK